MTELEKLQHRVNLVISRLESLKTANTHRKVNYIYILKESMDTLSEDKKPLEWSCGVNNIRIICDIEGLNKYLDRAEQFLVAHVRRPKNA